MLEFIKKNSLILILSAIILLGASLRLHNFQDLVRFNDDQSRDSLIIDRMIEKNDFPLLGPKAGGTKFNLGPAFYYLEYLSALVFGQNPSGMAFVIVLLSILSIPLFFVFLNYFFPKNISLLVTFFYSISFYMIKYSKFVWNPNVIPFFFLAFLILVFKVIEEKNDKLSWKPILLGITAGISVQLHTLLLIMIPILLILIFGYLKIIEKKIRIKTFSAIILISLALNSPLFIHDIKNNGENLKLFFKGTEKKTENDSTLKELGKDGQFFVQGNVYVLSGFEAQKDWTDAKKFFTAKNSREIAVATMGTIFFFGGLILLILALRKENNEERKLRLKILLGTLFLYFLIFWPLASELKSRFFIVCFLFPFLFLGFIFQFLSDLLKNKKLFCVGVLLILALFAFSNYKTFQKAYDFSSYANKDDIYGGISLKESKEISSFIVESSRQENFIHKKFRLGNFKFNKSIKYLNKRSGLDTPIESASSMKKLNDSSILVWLGKSKNEKKIIEKNSQLYSLASSKNLGRFTVFLFEIKK